MGETNPFQSPNTTTPPNASGNDAAVHLTWQAALLAGVRLGSKRGALVGLITAATLVVVKFLLDPMFRPVMVIGLIPTILGFSLIGGFIGGFSTVSRWRPPTEPK